MDPFHVVCWVFAYIGFLFIQSLIILGIKISAHGETKILPDGSEQNSSMILYPLQKFLLQHKMRKVFYSGAEFEKLWTPLKHKYMNLLPGSINVTNGNISFDNEEDNEVMKKLCFVFERDYELQSEFDGKSFRFYKEFVQFRFSKYVRMPIIQCIKCMSSFWSIFFTFTPVMVYLFGWQWWLLPLALFNIFALAYLNNWLYRSDEAAS